ncbi:MAG: hypothetical protein KDF54_03015 [Hydrogenophaga sp.]|nr:hypothetical protein [Hydrogenophaga sp.]
MNAASGNARPRLSLEISAQETLIGASDGRVWRLPVGTRSLWTPSAAGPSAVAVEQGIQTVEDAIERVARQVPRGAVLVPTHDLLWPLRRNGAIASQTQGSIGADDIEREYQWLAARAAGAPSARGTGFDAPAGDALVLILRELMHHLGVVSLALAD